MTRFTIMATLVAFGLGMTILPDVGFAAGKKQNKDNAARQNQNWDWGPNAAWFRNNAAGRQRAPSQSWQKNAPSQSWQKK